MQLAVEHRDALAGMIEGVLQEIAAVLNRRRGIVEKLQRRLGRDVAAAQEQRQGQARRGGADGRGEQMLRVAQEVDVGFGAPVQRQSAAAQEALEGAVGPLFAEIACDGGAQILDRDAAPEQAQGRRDGAAVAADEGGRLQPLQGVRRPQQREAHIGGDVQAEAPGDAVHQLREIGAEQGGRAQERLAERTARDEVGPEAALPGDAGEKQRVGPDRKPGDETGAGAEGGAARPEQAAEEGRRDLGDGREGQKPDGGEGRLARAPVIHVGEEQHDGDGDAPHAQDEAAEIGRAD